jgi:hypothetical protein
MLGPKLNTVFRNRWRALWFAASVLVSAWFMIPRPGEDDADTGKTVAALISSQEPTAEPSKSPWAP